MANISATILKSKGDRPVILNHPPPRRRMKDPTEEIHWGKRPFIVEFALRMSI